VEEGGARRATFTAGLCWAGGFLLSAVGVYMHNIWMVCLGYGVLGGFGLGIQLHLAYLHPDPMVPPIVLGWRPEWRSWVWWRRIHRIAAAA
jgi:hypothetical protein